MRVTHEYKSNLHCNLHMRAIPDGSKSPSSLVGAMTGVHQVGPTLINAITQLDKPLHSPGTISKYKRAETIMASPLPLPISEGRGESAGLCPKHPLT